MEQKPTRTRILDAAHELLRTAGLARTTTKQIARAAGCSEAALYKYFPSKEELFVTVLDERLPRLGDLLGTPGAGTETPGAETAGAETPGAETPGVEENLVQVARRAALFYQETFAMAASLYAEPQLKRRHDDALRRLGTGPHKPIEGLADYLRAEQRRGRIAADADPQAAAALLLGACAQRAFAYDMTPDGRPPQDLDTFARSIARTLMRGLG
ncbi:TetR/AcrR family transcriptional regulator [Streptomyces sp. NPDC059071]|uniref:TetR/AcrR family transcriptional regulator n=1 Tax=unclassified Streptomyces TaxID=2593676 RepID=UPI00363F1B32